MATEKQICLLRELAEERNINLDDLVTSETGTSLDVLSVRVAGGLIDGLKAMPRPVPSPYTRRYHETFDYERPYRLVDEIDAGIVRDLSVPGGWRYPRD